MPEEMVAEVEEVVDAGGEGESGAEGHQEGAEGHQRQEAEDPYSSKASREYSQYLKELRDSGDPRAAKFARLAKDNHGAMFALKQLEQRGLDGVRDKYALLDSVIHQGADGTELKGADAIAALQDSAREIAEIDAAIAAGDSAALDSFDDAMKAGIVKMAPAILSMAQKMDPEGYAAAVLPHFVQALGSSEWFETQNALAGMIGEKPPAWLPADKLAAWNEDKNQRIAQAVSRTSAWWNAQIEKAGKLPKAGENGAGGGKGKDTLSERETQFNQREQDHHWNTNISPKLDQHAAQSFSKLFAPFAKRLNLDAPTANALKGEWSKRVAQAAAKEKPYMDQIKRYRSQRNPDPATVLNFAKVQFDKHAKTVMESLVNERYKPFLNQKQRTAATTTTNGAGKSIQPPPKQGVQVVTVRPPDDQIDHKRRTIDQIHAKIFPLRNGKTVQLRA